VLLVACMQGHAMHYVIGDQVSSRMICFQAITTQTTALFELLAARIQCEWRSASRLRMPVALYHCMWST
jgi:hypothetical protein